MAPRTIRLEDSVYERIAVRKQEDETFSEAIDRLLDEYSLLDFAGGYVKADARHHWRHLERDVQQRPLETAIRQYTLGDVSLGRAAEIADVSLRRFIDELDDRGIEINLDKGDFEAELDAVSDE